MSIPFSNKPRPIITLTEANLERVPILRELRQVLFRDRLLDAFLLAAPPAANAFAHAFGVAVEGPGSPSRARRPFVAVMPAHARRDIAQEGLVVGLQGHLSMDIISPIPRPKISQARKKSPRWIPIQEPMWGEWGTIYTYNL